MSRAVCVLVLLVPFLGTCLGSRLPLEMFEQLPEIPIHQHRLEHQLVPISVHIPETAHMRILYQIGNSEEDLSECRPHSVCNKVDVYEAPWLERQCRCPGRRVCPSVISADDGHTLVDKNRRYKLCEPVKKLPKCRYFRDATWTLIANPDNTTEQRVHCHCPKNSMTYLIKRQAYQVTAGQTAYQYQFACSPQSRLLCQRKEPCRLFTVRKSHEFVNEVNMNTLCQCPYAHRCPRHHTEHGVLAGKSYIEEAVRIYNGYCLPNT